MQSTPNATTLLIPTCQTDRTGKDFQHLSPLLPKGARQALALGSYLKTLCTPSPITIKIAPEMGGVMTAFFMLLAADMINEDNMPHLKVMPNLSSLELSEAIDDFISSITPGTNEAAVQLVSAGTPTLVERDGRGEVIRVISYSAGTHALTKHSDHIIHRVSLLMGNPKLAKAIGSEDVLPKLKVFLQSLDKAALFEQGSLEQAFSSGALNDNRERRLTLVIANEIVLQSLIPSVRSDMNAVSMAAIEGEKLKVVPIRLESC